MERTGSPSDNLIMTPRDVAKLFCVDPKTVTRWANDGKLPSFRTPGGQRRFRASDVLPLLERRER